jgi:hypothetical protein
MIECAIPLLTLGLAGYPPPPRAAAPPQITEPPAPLPRPDPRGLARLPANPVHRGEEEAKPIIWNQCPTPFAVQRERRWRCV